MLKVDDHGQLFKYLMDTPLGRAKRPTRGPRDFGDDDTVGLYLKRIGTDWRDDRTMQADAFGIYLGRHGPHWVVAIKDFLTWKPVSCELFDSLDELKQQWELD